MHQISSGVRITVHNVGIYVHYIHMLSLIEASYCEFRRVIFRFRGLVLSADIVVVTARFCLDCVTGWM